MPRSSINPPRHDQQGFTIVEMIVVVVVAGILAIMVFDSLGDFYQSNSAVISQTVQTTDTRSVLRTIESDIVGAAGFATTLTATTPTGMNNSATAWNYQTNDSSNASNRRVLIAATYGTDKASSDDTRQLEFVQSGGTCDTVNGTPFQNYLVYFVAQDSSSGLYNLYRRTMVGSGTPCPNALFQKQSCSGSNVAAYPSVCKATDAVLLYDVTSFSVDYYAAASDQSAIADQYGTGSTNIPAAKAVAITVTTNRRINGVTTPYTSSLRISRFN